MASFSIDVDALTASDVVKVLIGTTAGGAEVATYTYTTTGSKAETFEPTAATMYIDVQGYDSTSDAHTIRVDDISIIDGSEVITNGGFASDTTGWTQVTATIASDTAQLLMTGFGGPGAPTVARQSFSTSFSASAGGSSGGCRVFGKPAPNMLRNVDKAKPLPLPLVPLRKVTGFKAPAEHRTPDDLVGGVRFMFKGFADQRQPPLNLPHPVHARMPDLEKNCPLPDPPGVAGMKGGIIAGIRRRRR